MIEYPKPEPTERGPFELDEEGGLPEWMTSPGLHFGLALFFVMYVVPFFFSAGSAVAELWSPKPIKVVRTDCIGVDSSPPEDQVKILVESDTRGAREAKLRSMNGALHYIESCPIGACSAEDLKNYYYYVGRYLRSRLGAAEGRSRAHGVHGVRWAHQLYAEPGDWQIEHDLRKRAVAGQLDLARFQSGGPVARWLVERGSNQPFKLCPKS